MRAERRGLFLELAAEFAGGPEGGEECDEGGEGRPVGPKRGARDDGARLGEGVDFVDERGDLIWLDDAAASDVGDFFEDFRACRLSGFFDFRTLGDEAGFERIGFVVVVGDAEFPGAGLVDFEAAAERAPGGFQFFEAETLAASVG